MLLKNKLYIRSLKMLDLIIFYKYNKNTLQDLHFLC